MTKRIVIAFWLILVSLGAARAQTPAPSATTAPEPDYPIVRVGVLSYVQYDAELENRDGYNVFDLTRGYINVTGQLAQNVRFRITPDVRRATSDTTLSGSLILRIKYAFVELDNLKAKGSWLRFGAHQTPWLDFEEGIDRYRVQGTMFSERENLIPGSSDFGVGYFTPLGKYIDIQTGVYNGEGYAQTDLSKQKSVQGRVTLRPFAGRGTANGFRFSGFFSGGWYAADRPRRLGIVMGSFEQTHLVTTLQYVIALENPNPLMPRNLWRSGPSGFIEIRQGLQGWAALARVDLFDPNQSVPDNSQRRVIAGGAYWFVFPRNSRVALVATNEQVHYAPASGRVNENRLLVQTLIEF